MEKLHLTLKKQWFDMILSGEKKEEYREDKEYWENRLCIHYPSTGFSHGNYFHTSPGATILKKYDIIIFRNGYSKNAPEITIKCLGLSFKEGNPKWGAEKGKKYFVLSLGEILSTKNIK